MATKSWTPDDHALRRLSEHLLYELRMTFYLAQKLDAGAGTVLEPEARNFEVESFAIHVRQLIDFVWRERPTNSEKTDAFAADYFAAGAWAKMRPVLPVMVDRVLQDKVGWGVAHLTYDRVWAGPKEWFAVRDVASALLPALVKFVDEVDAGKFEPGTHEHIRAVVAEYDSYLNYREL